MCCLLAYQTNKQKTIQKQLNPPVLKLNQPKSD